MSTQHAAAPRASRRVTSVATVVLVTAAVGCMMRWLPSPRAASGAWPGVDDVVIHRVAEAAGQAAPSFALDWVQGDLLLFGFLSAGLVAGFVLGFCGRAIFVEQRERTPGQVE